MADDGQNPNSENMGNTNTAGNNNAGKSDTANGTTAPNNTNGGTSSDIMIPKHRFDEVTQAKARLESQISEMQKKLDEQSQLQKKFDDLAAELEQTKKTYESEKMENKRQIAIKNAIGDKVVDLEVVNKLIDHEKIVFNDKGELQGLDEQIKDLQKNKPFLFKPVDKRITNSQTANGPVGKSFAQTLAEKKIAQQSASRNIKKFF